jgi:hypothetical protein
MFGESLMSGFDVVGAQATPSMPTASSYGNGARCGARTRRAASPMTTIGLMPVEPDARVVTSLTRSAPSATSPPPLRPEERSRRIPDSRKNRTPWPHWGCDRSGGARSSYTCRASQRRHSLRRSWHGPVGRRKASLFDSANARTQFPRRGASVQRVDHRSRRGCTRGRSIND